MPIHRFSRLRWLGIGVTLTATVLAGAMAWILYDHTVDLLTDNLKQRLLSIVRTGAVQFDPDDILALKQEPDWQKPEWAKVVNQLKDMRLVNDNVLFAYIFRKSESDPNKLEFVSDSHSINPYAQLDLNDDQIIDDADLLQWPGQPYDEPPPEAFEGFNGPVTNNEIYEDQWGQEITGYAPIYDAQGQSIAVLALDMKADDFTIITQQTLFPFIIFITFLILILIALAFVLIGAWDRQLRLVTLLDRQKDELLSIVAHQLGGPITSIRWGLESMHDGDQGELSEGRKKEMNQLMQSAAGLSDLTSLLLDLSRIELGRLSVSKHPTNLTEFFNQILSVIVPFAKAKGVQLGIDIPEKLPEANIDSRLTRMTIENLLNNGVKYTQAGGSVRFKVEVNGRKVRCTIADTGCGIPKEEQKLIFTKLFRASNVRDKVQGNGFGLYIAKGAIEQQGGSIECRSEVNRGTTFIVTLPI